MMKYTYTNLLLLVFCIYCKGQDKTDLSKVTINSKTKEVITSHGPTTSVRTIRQDSKGNMWLVTTEGVIRYDGKSFTNITSKVGSHKFWDVLEDRRGNYWFASIGSGVYYYDGKSFRNYTTKEGLASNFVFEIYEDKAGIIWFGTYDGASRYDGKSFRNFKMKEAPPSTHAPTDSVRLPVYHKENYHPELYEVYWMINETNNRIHTIMEDKTGKLWFGTGGDVCIYDGKTYTSLTKKYGKTLTRVNTIIEDKKGNIWLSGGGLWRYDGRTFTNFTRNSVGYVYEDRKGNIWTSSRSDDGPDWALSRYDEGSLSNKTPRITKIKSGENGLFGISEARDGSIWFGATDGVYRYDGKTVKKL